MVNDHEFYLCLTHDVDRPYKTFQYPYYALKERDLSHLRSWLSSERPYWQFGNIMKLEDELGVRSTFFFLNEKNLFRDKSPRKWLKLKNWKLYTGRYDIKNPDIKKVIKKLDENGWEVGLHGSYDSYLDVNRLRHEKKVLEDILGHEVIGIRQHYLNLKKPDTWENHKEVGLKYDSSLGFNEEYGFHYGDEVKFPFDDDFAVFPLTIMDSALMNGTYSLEETWGECERLLKQAKKRNAIMTILWHPRMFNEKEFPGYAKIYRKIIEKAQEMDAWVGPIKKLYGSLV